MKKIGFVKSLCAIALGLFALGAQPKAMAAVADTDVAKIGDTGYATLLGAVNAATGGATIDILKDYTLPGQSITLNKDMTINLNGHTIGPNVMVFRIKGVGTEIVINGADSGDGVGCFKGGICIHSPENAGDTNTLMLNGGTYEYPSTGTYSPISSESNGAGACEITATGATFSTPGNSEIYAISLAANGSLTLSDCAVEAAKGVYNKAASIAINGGTILATSAAIVLDSKSASVPEAVMDVTIGASETSVPELKSKDRYAIEEVNAGNGTKLHSLTITAGKFTGHNDYSAVYANPILVSDAFLTSAGAYGISGGQFSSRYVDTAPDQYTLMMDSRLIAAGYEAVKDMSTVDNSEKLVYFEVRQIGVVDNNVAQIVGGEKYETLQAAVDAVQSADQTIKILKPIELSETVTIAKSLILDLNGKAITAADNVTALAISGDSTVVAINAPAMGGSIAAAGTGHAIDVASAAVEITAGTFTSANAAAINVDLASAGKLAISGGTFTGTPALGVPEPFDFQGPGQITGGTYSSEPPAKLVAEGYEAKQKSGASTWIVVEKQPVVENPAAEIGDTQYATLQEAVTKAVSGATIKILRPIALSEAVTISKSLTIDLNGQAITAANVTAFSISGADTVVTINDPATGGSITATGTGHAIDATSAAAVKITAGTFTSANAAVNVDLASAGKLAISGGTFTGTPALGVPDTFAGPGQITGGT